jgi:hypothetical protein
MTFTFLGLGEEKARNVPQKQRNLMFALLTLFSRPHNVFHLVDKARYFSFRAKVTETVRQ